MSAYSSGAGIKLKVGGTCPAKHFCRAPPLFWLHPYSQLFWWALSWWPVHFGQFLRFLVFPRGPRAQPLLKIWGGARAPCPVVPAALADGSKTICRNLQPVWWGWAQTMTTRQINNTNKQIQDLLWEHSPIRRCSISTYLLLMSCRLTSPVLPKVSTTRKNVKVLQRIKS